MLNTPFFLAMASVLAWLMTFIPRAVVQGVPLMLGSTGETLTEKSGNLNLGIPGIMYVGGITGVIGSYLYDKSLTERATQLVSEILDASGGKLMGAKKMAMLNQVYAELQSDFLTIAIPVVCCLLGALLMGLIYSFLTVTLRANQNVTGLALTTFGTGLGNFFGGSIAKLAGGSSANINLKKISTVFKQPLLGTECPEWLNETVRLNLLTILGAVLIVLIVASVLYRDPEKGVPKGLQRATVACAVVFTGVMVYVSRFFTGDAQLIVFLVEAVALLGLVIAWIVLRLTHKRAPVWLRWLVIALAAMLVALMGMEYGFTVYLAIAISAVTAYFLNRTRKGLQLRAVGENPATADAAGISVNRYKYVATCVGAMIAGLGGLYYVLDYASGIWSNNAFGDRGWLAIALVIFTIWRPGVGIAASFLFGGLYILNMYIPTGDEQLHMKELYKMIPYVVTLLVLIISSIRNRRDKQPPAHLGLPYFREDR